MNFAYQGFTHKNDRRRFTFWGTSSHLEIANVFSIEVDLPLLLRNRVSVQELPMFCLKMLTTASVAGPDILEKLRDYRLIEADFRPLAVERAKVAAEKAAKKPPRRPSQKPSPKSSISWTPIAGEH